MTAADSQGAQAACWSHLVPCRLTAKQHCALPCPHAGGGPTFGNGMPALPWGDIGRGRGRRGG